MKEKQCTRCEEIKPIENFVKRKISLDGFTDFCNSCREEKEREYQALRKYATKGFIYVKHKYGEVPDLS